MKEEYLENDECVNYNQFRSENYSQNTQPSQTHQRLTESQNKSKEFFPVQPQDYDAHSDDIMLKKLLKKFQMSFLYPFFKAYDITYRSLRYLSVDDINTAIRSVGHRAEFREKLFTWRRKRYRTNDTIIEHEKSSSFTTNTNVECHRKCNSEEVSNNHKEIQEIDNTQSTPIGSFTTLAEFILPLESENTNFESDMVEELPIKMDMDGVEAKRPKLKAVVGLRETRLNSLLNLEELINESVFGPITKAFYNKNGYLERKHRDELIQAIVDFVIGKEIKLHCSDFSKIVDMIVNIFPTEDDSRDYYFINRKGKRNPMGRLYTKYYNKLKRIRVRDIHQEFTQDSSTYMQQSDTLADDDDDDTILTTDLSVPTSLTMATTNVVNANDGNNIGNSCTSNTTNNNTQIELIEEEFEELIQLDDTSISAIKNFLCCQGLNWDDVKTMWSKTYLSRQEDVEHSTTKDVLQQWPKYLNARAMELFDIDFGFKYSRNKLNILERKWPSFVQKISNYYQSNIKDEMCKGLFALWKSNPGKDTEDYIITILLNAIMIPMARYRDAIGNRRKVSIVEACDLFAMRVNNLEELDQKREELAIKFGDINNEFTPLIVLVGDNNVNVHEIYVHFDVALYEMPDFIRAIDTCMKIFRVLNLPYPASNEYVWTFIQRHFYEIQMPDDIKCPSMNSLITALKL
ncbi:uncharacterized protein LOC142240014 [Haematobia irritans]|uniref:uncharacterized protein LOC142240014 n=1 Tax=Haematobia irritans TaxID=7368 RepID=UPI003F4FE4A8